MFHIDPILSLASALHETRGGYAFLIGSGISRAAGIPTGWEVVLDLIGRVAVLEGGTIPADPAAWYRERYGGEPDYSVLLEALAGTPAERRQLLRSYFEPTEEDRTAGVKVPTAAHRAIAELALRGHVRVILTTNFDRLLEQAMEAAGVSPAVVSAADALDGAMPLVHAPITVVKLHGDYLDSRLRNTEAELGTYEARIDLFLDRVLDEFGLVVCGWSASWDRALRRAIERCPTRRFTTWWAAKGELGGEASGLVAQRRARVVPIESADSFFQQLIGRLIALEDIASPHPASPAISVAMVKRYLVDPSQKIRLHDLVMDEVTRTVSMSTTGAAVIPEAPGGTYESARETIRTRVAALEAASESLVAMLAVGCYWGAAENLPLWTKVVERLAAEVTRSGSTDWYQQLRHYPALLALYAAALGSMAAGHEEVAIGLLLEPKVMTNSGSVPVVAEINATKVLHTDALKQLPGLERRTTPGSDHLLEHLKPVFKSLLPDPQRFEAAFDRFEYLLALTFLGQKTGEVATGWAPLGRFSWRQHSHGFSLLKDVEAEAKQAGSNWLLFRLGLFGGSLDEFLTYKKEFDQFSYRLR
jgi:hypothetical protein